MPRKKSPFFQKVSRNLLKISIFVSKMTKPKIPKLILLKKSVNLGGIKLLIKKQKNYGFLLEYEFSASSTPLIDYNQRKYYSNGSCGNINKLYSMVFLFKCFRGLKAVEETREVDYSFSLESVPSMVGKEQNMEPLDFGENEEDSVDERAERFISMFYQEMRMQRMNSE